eukprot:gnl/TRDRNA2_/TRDRNA2_131427_c0_seq1.p1 gnl/TRDRNA2_/TRDRNA2_131427_c0~~gnl/TRDRNA2_/TRDRNA2_131427_c0_seq1.p1  ORF type:complete len:904 (+),score=256.85 gnl/TRDRNA2_/TRDRNA2_131427_c0_seq1:83-2794(+)
MVSMEEDLGGQMRRQIAQVTSEKEQAKYDLESLKRTVDQHLLRLNSLLAGADVPFDRLCSAIQAFDADLRGRLDVDPSVPSATDALMGQPLQVLRNSLHDAQNRCQVLTSDMNRQADTNDELVHTLNTLKSTNKRLVEEVQKQTEEVTSLTQQRVLDIENITRLEEAFRQEQAMWHQEAQRAVDDEQRRTTEEFEKMRTSLTAQLHECWSRAKMTASKVGHLRGLQSQLKSDILTFSQAVSSMLKQKERDLLDRLTETAKRLHAEQTRLHDKRHKLEVQLKTEKEIRENETENWRIRHKALSAELEELNARRDREVSTLKAQIEAIQANRESAASSQQADRQALHEQVEEFVKSVAHLEAQTHSTRRRGLQLESRLAQHEGERDRLMQLSETLRQQIRESTEALHEAVRSNEALREQMEIARQEGHGANERDLALCREMFEKKLDMAAQGYASEQGELARRITAYEQNLGLRAGELQVMREALVGKTRQRDALQRDLILWKGQYELAAKMKGDVEREFAQFKQESIGGELKRLQERHDELNTKKDQLEIQHAEVAAEFEEAKRVAKHKESSLNERAALLEASQQEAEAEVQRVRTALAETEKGLAEAKADAAAMTQAMSEKRDGLEQDLARLTTELEVEKAEFDRKIANERQNGENLRESFERLRAEHRSSYKAAYEGPVQQITALEGAISEIQRSSDAELAGMRQNSEKLRLRIDELETELARVQARLQQSEAEVQEGTARVQQAKVQHRTAKEVLEREKMQKTEELQQVQRQISQKSEQLKGITRSGEDTRRRMLRNVEEAKALKAKQLAEADRRMTLLRTEYSPALEDRDFERRGTSRSHVEELVRENEELKKSVGETRHAASHLLSSGSQLLSGSGSQVHRSLASMEDRAAALQRQLQR